VSCQSWGRTKKADQKVVPIFWRDDPFPGTEGKSALPFGNGRSYGDSCLNDGGFLLDVRKLDRFLSFDRTTGILRCEAGVLLSDILSFSVPQGWFLPVTPGTKYVTVGGAIANDVHGKNHHRSGTFGCHVLRFEILRSDDSRILCSPYENRDFFSATIGGLGLTGVILWAEIALKPIASPLIRSETIRFGDLSEFFILSEESDRDYEYTVSWIDCLGQGKSLGRGLFMRGNHASPLVSSPGSCSSRKVRNFPVALPFSMVNALTLRVFNTVYYRKQVRKHSEKLGPYDPFFYPLDGIGCWNRMYGRKGFYQYQCVIPEDREGTAVRRLLSAIARSGEGSFLAVLKHFGNLSSPGLLSFPRPGITLALDFPNRGEKTLSLFNRLDEIVASSGGAVYPAKDARMSGKSFRRFFPKWEEFLRFKDPGLSSDFWRRVTIGEG